MQVLSNKLGLCAVAAAACLAIAPAQADTGKLSLTGGITSIDGAAGGGITPWATIGTMGNEIGVSAAVSTLRTNDYDFRTTGLAIAFKDRYEISIGKQELGLERSNDAAGQRVNMDIIGLKYRVAGDAILDSDNLMPQISVGVLNKRISATETVMGVIDSLAADR